MSKMGIVLVVLYLLSSPVNLQQNEDNKAFSKMRSPTQIHWPDCNTCSANDDGRCVGTCCDGGVCEGGNLGCGCLYPGSTRG
nr:TPA_inf: conotoxin precursor SF-mi1 [Conus ebraeus]